MFSIAFHKSRYANPYYFSAAQLSVASRVLADIEAYGREKGIPVRCVFQGGHRNTTGYDALLSVETEEKASFFSHLWEGKGYDITVREECND